MTYKAQREIMAEILSNPHRFIKREYMDRLAWYRFYIRLLRGPKIPLA